MGGGGFAVGFEGMELKLVGFFEAIADAEAHQVIGDFYGDGPLGIVDVGEVMILFGEQFYLFEDFFVIEFVVVAALKIQAPALDFVGDCVYVEKLVYFLYHSEMFGLEGLLDWQDAVAKPGD